MTTRPKSDLAYRVLTSPTLAAVIDRLAERARSEAWSLGSHSKRGRRCRR
jgi:hypothetical protein